MARSSASDGAGRSVSVILTGGEHVSVLGAVRALRAAGHMPWVAVHERGTYAARSRATAGIIDIPTPWDDPDGFAAGIASAAERIQPAVILPGTEFGMVTLAQHAGAFPSSAVLGVPPLATIADATDKGKLGHFARAVGLATPRTIEASLADVPVELPFAFPVVVKPHRSEHRSQDGAVRHHGARLAWSGAGLRSALAVLPGERGLVQPFMPGSLVSLAGVFWDGRLVAAVQSRADRLWPAPCGSISHAETVALDPALAERIADLLRCVGWRGIFQVDLFESSGQYHVIDLNPRFYTSLAHATRAGVNLPALWVDLLLGREPEVPGSYRVGVHYRHEEGDIRALVGMLAHGPRAAALRGLIPRRDTALAVFSPTDPWPLMTSVGRWLRRRGLRGRPARGRSLVGDKGRAAA